VGAPVTARTRLIRRGQPDTGQHATDNTAFAGAAMAQICRVKEEVNTLWKSRSLWAGGLVGCSPQGVRRPVKHTVGQFVPVPIRRDERRISRSFRRYGPPSSRRFASNSSPGGTAFWGNHNPPSFSPPHGATEDSRGCSVSFHIGVTG